MSETHWQPIETAPLDGTHVLIMVDRDKFPKPCVGYFTTDMRPFFWLTWPGAIRVNPTHWTPLQFPQPFPVAACKCGGNQLPNVSHSPEGCYEVTTAGVRLAGDQRR